MLPKISALAAAALCAAAAVPAVAAADSLVYVKDGNVFLSAADGSAARQVTTDGGYESPSQADDGTIVAGRRTEENGRTPRRLHRMDRDGRALNAPVETVAVDNSFYIGPLEPKVSPDGRYVAASGPTWSPGGRTLAWGEDDGIHTMRLDDLGACGSAPRPLTVPGGASPDFGPAAAPAAPQQQAQQPGPGTGPVAAPAPRSGATAKGPKLTLARVARSVRRAALRRGLAVRVTCATACSLSATLKAGGRTVARGSARGKARRAAVVRLKGRPKRGGRATLTVTARGAGGATTVVTRAMTLR
jgi:hypothetical protein